MKKGVLRNFTKFTGKHLRQSPFFNKVGSSKATLLKTRLWHRCFPLNFTEFLRTPFVQNTFGWLLLTVPRKYVNTFKARSQTSINKHNPTCGMCYCGVRCLIPIATDTAKKVLLAGNLTNLYPYIQCLLEWPFSELFFYDVLL